MIFPPKITKLVISNSFSFKPPYLHCHPAHNFVAWLWRHHRKQYQVASESSPLPCLPQVHVYHRCEMYEVWDPGGAGKGPSWGSGQLDSGPTSSSSAQSLGFLVCCFIFIISNNYVDKQGPILALPCLSWWANSLQTLTCLICKCHNTWRNH